MLFYNFVDAYRHLSIESFSLFINTYKSEEQQSFIDTYLKPILIPRVSGTENSRKVQNFIIKNFNKLGWEVEQDKFKDQTPYGKIEFNNIIVTKNPNASKRLVLAAHYDSKLIMEKTPGDDRKYVGATDSALSCAILMHLANKLDPFLMKKNDNKTTLQLIFFDDGIEVLVLLDLLGAKELSLVNFYPKTSWMFKEMAKIERQLRNLKLLKTSNTATNNNKMIFDEYSIYTFRAHIDDDHIPFLKRNVPILHLISYPFPDVWHTLDDDFSAIDLNTVHDLNLIFRLFVAQYLDIDPSSSVIKTHQEL
ncbi:8227_t:CDS:2 [Entrophospora sp. SA101]|nr:6303_t:CDS:2 [Entrophospora sp. SA101]CAJ0638065.1 8227_t:CDS:2 [Entrophospora sp. SA101]CAJ0835831.1 2369_t:CDS:2 [Entrophospora sp. SA101]CAJ0902819.1 701_t:CDS:2 [Entrophospora sp. SA101]